MKNKSTQLKRIILIFLPILVLLISIGIISSESSTKIKGIDVKYLESALLVSDENSYIEAPIKINNEEQKSANENNLCLDVVCENYTAICPDGFVSSCENICSSETGQCNNCALNCDGHEQTNETENETDNEQTNETIFPEQNETENNLSEGVIKETEINETETLPETGKVILDQPPQSDLDIHLDIQIDYPTKIIRDEIVEIKALISKRVFSPRA